MHSSTKPPVARLPRELYLAAIISNLLLFLKIYSTLSLDDFEAPLLQSISFFSPGINLQSSSTFSLAIPAAYSLPPVVMNRCAPGKRMHRSINARIARKDLLYARGNVAYAYLCLITALKKIL